MRDSSRDSPNFMLNETPWLCRVKTCSLFNCIINPREGLRSIIIVFWRRINLGKAELVKFVAFAHQLQFIVAESPCYVLLSFSRNGTSWRQKSTIINKAISRFEREKHTTCFDHGLPESPSRSMNARSAIINLSFHSLTFWGSFFQIDSPPLFSSNACEIEFNFYVERVCVWGDLGQEKHKEYLSLVIYFGGCPFELLYRVEQRNKVYALTWYLLF